MFVTFEGIDGAGKTSVIQELKRQAPDAFVFRTPGWTKSGQEIRNLLLHHGVSKRAQPYLFLADMVDAMDSGVLTQIKSENTLVISDRFIDSTFVYQVLGGKMPRREEALFVETAREVLPTPDLTFILDVPVSVVAKRLSDQRSTLDFFERQIDAWEERRSLYLSLPREFPWREYEILDGGESIEKNVDTILEKLALS